ncbi:SDR family NAD(P)-dependent oxidoreductase [Salinisphaera orenii]|uniref:SDR family NAD(P)-dependent oxidoreductase n=1 Tax=Salinisphaera orenii TaxID=856731 RepID=UPI000DBE0929
MSESVTLITGASSGIGRALSLRLARRGGALALVARRAESLAETAEAVRAAGGEPITRAVDVTDARAMAAAVAEIETEVGPVDCLVANAGGGQRMGASEFDAEVFNAIVEVNLLGAANSVASVLPAMRRRGRGQIVMIGSLAARVGLPRAGAYSAAKAGVARLAASLRVELAREAIDVTLIEPGFVDTKGRSKTGSRKKPFRMSLEHATARIERAIDRRIAVAAFPAVLVGLTVILRVLPRPVYNYVLRRLAG